MLSNLISSTTSYRESFVREQYTLKITYRGSQSNDHLLIRRYVGPESAEPTLQSQKVFFYPVEQNDKILFSNLIEWYISSLTIILFTFHYFPSEKKMSRNFCESLSALSTSGLMFQTVCEFYFSLFNSNFAFPIFLFFVVSFHVISYGFFLGFNIQCVF